MATKSSRRNQRLQASATEQALLELNETLEERVAERTQALAEANHPAQRLVLVGTAAGHVEGARRYVTKAVAADTIVIHGSADTTVPLANVLAWAEPLDLPVIVVAGADHFFHRRLHLISDIVTRAWRH